MDKEEKFIELTELEENLLYQLSWHNKDICLENESYKNGIIDLIEFLRENYISKEELNKLIYVKCGDANPNGNVALNYKGGCGKKLKITEAYRCVGCGGWFHYDCILKHFELEEGHDDARNVLKKIENLSDDEKIKELCKKGLLRVQPKNKIL